MRTNTKLEKILEIKFQEKIKNKNKLQPLLGGRYAGCFHLFPFLYRLTR